MIGLTPLEQANKWLSVATRQKLMSRLAVLYGALFVGTTFIVTFLVSGLTYGAGGVIGADFLAFYTAGDMTLQGRANDAYDFDAFDAALQTRVPQDGLGLMWQYPPAMFLITAVLAMLPYKVSYWTWMLVTGGAFAWATNRLARDATTTPDVQRQAVLLLLAAPLCVGVFINGQISLLTAALLMLAAYQPRRAWLVAGLAAGLLTLKPQLGLLLPLAYLAVGAWRAIGVAAVTAIAIHGLALLVFGPESLSAFLNAVSRLQADVAGGGVNTPPVAMTTLFGQLRFWEVPAGIALSLQHVTALGVAVVVMFSWFRFGREDGQDLFLAALLCCGAILVTPYAYAYEMTALAPAALLIAFQPGRLARFAMVLLTGFWLVLALRRMIPPDFVLQLPFWVAITAFALLLASRFGSQNKA